MNWITTNLRLPEDIYMELKLKAAQERKSVAAVIREKLSTATEKRNNSNILTMFKNLGKKIAKENSTLNLTKSLIEMRSEQ